MNWKVEKLVQLALGSETVDEAIAALRRARKMQPTGPLTANLSPDWEKFEFEREKFDADRAAFEEERTAFHRRILIAEKERGARQSPRNAVARAWRGAAKFAGLTVAASALFASVTLATISYKDAPDGTVLGPQRSVCGVLFGFSLYRCGDR